MIKQRHLPGFFSPAMFQRLFFVAAFALCASETRFSLRAALPTNSSPTAVDSVFTRTDDVVYGRKYGTALTMDVFRPRHGANGAALVLVVSGGYYSAKEMISIPFARALTEHGYTVFAVLHGCQPRYQVPEIVVDVKRAVRFIRFHAEDYGINPKKIGATGGSAGGNLSLLLGTTGDAGSLESKDPVERQSSAVQAVACFFPPTDFLNWGATGREHIRGMDFDKPFRAAFDYHELDKETALSERVTDTARLREITRSISPIYYISKNTAPSLLIHGDQDTLVALQQSETFVAKLKEAGVDAKLNVRKGKGHGWPDVQEDIARMLEWFDGHLKPSGH